MKWYCVKKYQIPCDLGPVFVAVSFDDLCLYKIAEYKYDKSNDDYGWFTEDDHRWNQVTHFCIPAPVEKSEYIEE